MQNIILEIQEKQFGRMHNFHTERTANIMEAIYAVYGEEAINILEKSNVDFYGLFRWHIERTLSIVDTLNKTYGQTAVDIILKEESQSRREEGKRLASTLEKNTLGDIIPFFSNGNSENILEINDNMALVKSTGCLVGRMASDINRNEMLYDLHCNCDKDFVEGFNCNLSCEVVQTIMDGHDCCIHRIFRKD
jgi:hypothetical protein